MGGSSSSTQDVTTMNVDEDLCKLNKKSEKITKSGTKIQVENCPYFFVCLLAFLFLFLTGV